MREREREDDPRVERERRGKKPTPQKGREMRSGESATYTKAKRDL